MNIYENINKGKYGMSEYLTIAETTAKLKVCRNTLTKFVRSGHLRSCKIGKLIRIKAEDLESFIEGSARRSTLKKKTIKRGVRG
jgi:excisionase family DNA binding protein